MSVLSEFHVLIFFTGSMYNTKTPALVDEYDSSCKSNIFNMGGGKKKHKTENIVISF